MIKVKTKAELKALCDDLNANLQDIDTSLINDMSELFKDSLRSDFSFINHWDTSNVNDMSSMFENCVNLNEKLEIDVSSLRYANKMFYACNNLDLKNISLINFDILKVFECYSMIDGCANKSEFLFSNLKLNIKNAIVSPKNKAELMLLVCDESLPLAMIDTANIYDFRNLFAYSTRQNYDGLSKLKNKAFKSMFYKSNFYSDKIDVSAFLDPLKKTFKYFPKNKKELQTLIANPAIKLNEIDTGLITDMSDLFGGRADYEGVGEWDTSNVVSMSRMFAWCEDFNQGLEFDTKNVENMENMFYYCKSFNQKLEFNTSKIENFFSIK
ncbi:BspA family leucine-rich repeat surface protein [Campylobacter sp. MG1]|uniref:BspA family leucine-rich repeat surface protein n=1 Tax=Campylobacter sp. MG1 TaxID=2976332 RepID=UPI00226C68C9|nr:BspA family leucine-rich repeat surface protein [Campylobacter sp. MG1]